MSLRRIVQQPWFAITDLALSVISVVLWKVEPRLGLVPLVIALLPWLARGVAGLFPFQRTAFDGAILVFLLTAGVGVWAAYQPAGAWAKFWLLAGGALLFYALAGQPERNHWRAAALLSLYGVGSSAMFLLTDNWQQIPAKIGLVNQIGLWWMRVRPDLSLAPVLPNNAAGTVAFTAPFLVAIGLRAWRERRRLPGMLAAAGGVMCAAALVMATSRAGTTSMIAGLMAWLLAALYEQRGRLLPVGLARKARWIFALLLIGLAGAALAALGEPLTLLRVALKVPGASSRLTLASGATHLLGDFPFTGGGLNSFPGLYSHYILGIPNYFLLNSHNTYLDVALEQGVLGLLAFIAVYFGSIWLVLKRSLGSFPSGEEAFPGNTTLARASLAGLVAICLHSLIDNVIYNPSAAFMIFALPGLAVAVALVRAPGQAVAWRWPARRWLAALLGAAALAVLLLVGFYRPLAAAWLSDLAAVKMARIELADFPTNQWDRGHRRAALQPVGQDFSEALQLDSNQRVANHRLGLIALMGQDFSAASASLEKAHQADPEHHGITKALAYSYVWSGQPDRALPLLTELPEAREEMGNYIAWWRGMGRDDLSTRAEAMYNRLGGAGSP
ncbi:MAG TPA: O-antigen ligase family protein [Anaerolineaceae bacterium]